MNDKIIQTRLASNLSKMTIIRKCKEKDPKTNQYKSKILITFHCEEGIKDLTLLREGLPLALTVPIVTNLVHLDSPPKLKTTYELKTPLPNIIQGRASLIEVI